MTFTSIQMKMLNYSDVTIGFIHSAYYFGILLGVYFGEEIIILHGYIRTFIASVSLLGIAVVIMELSLLPTVWLIARITTGGALGTLYLVLESWLVKITPKSFHSRALSLYTSLVFISQVIGQVLLILIPTHTSLPFNISVLLILCSIPLIALNHIKPPQILLPNPEGIKTIINKSRTSCFFSFSAGIIISSLYSFIPIWAQNKDLNPAGITALLIISGAVFLFPIGSISDMVDRRKVLMAAALFLSSILSLNHYLLNSSYFIYFSITSIGATTFILYPITLSHTLDNFDSSKFMKVNSTMLLLYGLGSSIGPLYTSLWIHQSSNSGLFYSLATISYPLVILAFYSIFSKRPVHYSNKIEYTPLPSRPTQIIFRFEDN